MEEHAPSLFITTFYPWALHSLARRRRIDPVALAATLNLHLGEWLGQINACFPLPAEQLQAACAVISVSELEVAREARRLYRSHELPRLRRQAVLRAYERKAQRARKAS